MRLLILEDEQSTALDLQATLREIDPTVEIVAVLDSVESAIEWFRTHPSPDIAFFDVQLADGSSLDIFQETTVDCPVIFCTAFSEFALAAYQANGLEYLLKPFSASSVRNALNRVGKLGRFFQDKASKWQKPLAGNSKPVYRSTFLVAQKDKLFPIAVSDSTCFVIEDDVLFLHTADGKRFALQQSLDELERTLDPTLFFRANRQCIINRKAVVEIQHYFARKLLVKLKTPVKTPIVISKARASEFLHWMES